MGSTVNQVVAKRFAKAAHDRAQLAATKAIGASSDIDRLRLLVASRKVDGIEQRLAGQ